MTQASKGLLFLGTAGWSLRTEQQSLFPAGDSHLHRYSSIFSAVEVNSCFYRTHRKATWYRWANSTPENFRFSLKLPKSITHNLRLQNAHDQINLFLDAVVGLGDRRGTLLVQLPPTFLFDPRTVIEFFSLLQQQGEVRGMYLQVACEPRHPSWFTSEVGGLLKELKVAGVAAHPARPKQLFAPFGFDDHRYYRMHGAPRTYYSEYSEPDLQALALQLLQSTGRGIQTWCIFDNTADGYAVSNALQMLHIQEIAPYIMR